MIILYELVNFIKVIRMKMFALFAEVPFNRFGKGVALCRCLPALFSRMIFIKATLSIGDSLCARGCNQRYRQRFAPKGRPACTSYELFL